jgi:SLT domain-containing protein
MTLRRTRAENLAMTMLARDGIAAIWMLHLSAARAYRDGHKLAAAGIIEIAEAAEQEWLRRGETRVLNGWPNWRA